MKEVSAISSYLYQHCTKKAPLLSMNRVVALFLVILVSFKMDLMYRMVFSAFYAAVNSASVILVAIVSYNLVLKFLSITKLS